LGLAAAATVVCLKKQIDLRNINMQSIGHRGRPEGLVVAQRDIPGGNAIQPVFAPDDLEGPEMPEERSA
jgi:hypothetical protein